MKLYQYSILNQVFQSIDDIQSLLNALLEIQQCQCLTDELFSSYVYSIKKDSEDLKKLVLKLF